MDGLELFRIGSSRGGFESFAIPTYGTITREAASGGLGGHIVRTHVGLEDTSGLIADLERGFTALHHRRPVLDMLNRRNRPPTGAGPDRRC